jgi:hypothetical protein
VLLSEWNLTCEMFDGDVVSGPVPTLFSDRPEAAKAALANDPEKAFQDLGNSSASSSYETRVHPAYRRLGHRAEAKVIIYDTNGYEK